MNCSGRSVTNNQAHVCLHCVDYSALFYTRTRARARSRRVTCSVMPGIFSNIYSITSLVEVYVRTYIVVLASVLYHLWYAYDSRSRQWAAPG